MKQVLQNLRNGKTEVVEIPKPQLRAGFVLVQTAASLVSAGTERMVVSFAEKSLFAKARSRPDLVRQLIQKINREGLLPSIEAAFNRLEQPMPLGYSSAGTVVAIGAGVKNIQIGQRVACAGGNYAVHAEFALVPQNLCVPIPDGVDFESAAFSTLAAIALHGFRLSYAKVAERIAVIGLGLVGLLTVGVASAAGCMVLGIDIDDERLPLALKLGAKAAVLRTNAEEAARHFSLGRGVDAVIICADSSSADPIELAGQIARDRANIVASGAVKLHFPRKTYYEKELSFINSRSYGPGRYDMAYEEKGCDYPIGYVRWTEGRNLEAVVDLMANGLLNVKPLITHRFEITQAEAAYELISGKTNQSYLGILITYPQLKEDNESHVLSYQHISVKNKDVVIKQYQPLPTVNLGVLGAGLFASSVLLPAITKVSDVNKIGICSANGVSAVHAAKKFGFHQVYAAAEDIYSSSKINTVAILTRHHLHAQQTLNALKNGKNVFCEKPLAMNAQELAEIEQWLRENPKHPMLMVGFNRRFAPMLIQLKKFITTAKEPFIAHYRINAGFIPANHWVHDVNIGGGRIIAEICHFIDALSFLSNSMPILVDVQALTDMGIYQQDNLIITLKFDDGSLANINYTANGDKAFSKERIEVFCAGRVGVLDDFRSLLLMHHGKVKKQRSWLRQDKGHQGEWMAFATALTSTAAEPPIPYEQIFAVHRATFACVEALRSV